MKDVRADLGIVLAHGGQFSRRPLGLGPRDEGIGDFLGNASPKRQEPGEHPQAGPPRTDVNDVVDAPDETSLA